MAAFTSKAADDWNKDKQTSWNEVGHPVAGDTVTLGHDMTAKASVACATVASDSAGTVHTLTFDDTSNILTGTVTCEFSGATTDLNVIVNGHRLAAADAIGSASTADAFLVTGNVVANYPVGTTFTAAGTLGGTNNGTHIVVAAPTYDSGTNRTTIPVASALTPQDDTGGTLARWLPVAITALGNPGFSTGDNNSIEVAGSGCASITGQAGVDVVRVAAGFGIYNNSGFITTITGNQTAGIGKAIYNGGSILTIEGNQTCTTGTGRGISNGGSIIGTITGNQTTTTGKALFNDGGTIGVVVGNQTCTTGIALDNDGTIGTITGNQVATGLAGSALDNNGTIGTINGNQSSTTGNALDNGADCTITTLNGNQVATSTGVALNNLGTIDTWNGSAFDAAHLWAASHKGTVATWKEIDDWAADAVWKTDVAAADKVLSGEPRWAGATGADVGTLNTCVRIGD